MSDCKFLNNDIASSIYIPSKEVKIIIFNEVYFYFDPEDNFGILLHTYGVDNPRILKRTKHFTVVDTGVSITVLGRIFQAKRDELTKELDRSNYSVLPKEE